MIPQLAGLGSPLLTKTLGHYYDNGYAAGYGGYANIDAVKMYYNKSQLEAYKSGVGDGKRKKLEDDATRLVAQFGKLRFSK